MKQLAASTDRIIAVFIQAVEWLFDGLGEILPDRLARMGCRKRYQIVIADSPHGLSKILRHSLFGRWVIEPSDKTSLTDATFLKLEDKDCLSVSCTLPDAALRNLDQALSFQLKELSPLPTDRIYYATRLSNSDQKGRFKADLLLARREDIDSHNSDLAAPSIAGHISPNGAVSVFHRYRPADNKWIQPLSRLALLGLGASILMAGIAGFLERQNDAYQTQQAELVSAMRLMSDQTSQETALEALAGRGDPVNVEEFANSLEALLSDLPAGTMIETINLQGQNMIVQGYADAHASMDASPLTLLPERRGPYARFQGDIVLEAE